MRIALILVLGLVLIAVLALQAYVRLAPYDPGRWHTRPDMPEAGEGDWPAAAGHRAARYFPEPPDAVLARLDAIATAAPRTARIGGSVEDGMITWRSRSAVWGFPDFTTAVAEPADGGTRLSIYGRARFGRSDLGVNRTRVTRWLDELGA